MTSAGESLSFRSYRRNPRAMLLILLLSFLFQFNIVVLNKVYMLALGLHVDFGILLIIIPLIYLTEVLPISINGLGVRESAFAFFFVQIGLAVADALAVSVLIVGMRYLVGLLGGSLLLATVIASRAKAAFNPAHLPEFAVCGERAGFVM